jgi:hypothetical protein
MSTNGDIRKKVNEKARGPGTGPRIYPAISAETPL